MRSITLELLRHGPAHNQLLSPLTPYLALCENHGAITLHVSFEHNQFLHRLRALGYKLKDESRIFQLNDTARVLGEILSEIPGLTAELNKKNCSQQELTHLRLIISASELALLPFELALSPNGLPGSGQHLLLQPEVPICLTREIRRVPGEQLQWPKKPKILFIAAAPPGIGSIPLESHLLVLRRLISPWVRYYDEGNVEKRREKVEEHLHFLPNASIEAIEDACASGNFTHIHILAHGVEVPENYGTRFSLALHDAYDSEKTEFISGSRLATALRPSTRPDSQGLSMPVVVTLASCDSGNVGSVAGAGASIAHALHEAGIPMVVAGQFPLSFKGSVRLVDCLYEGLLWGTDPRPLLYDLRRRLYAQFQENHDWASLTAYVSLPSNFDEQLAGVKIEQVMDSINAAMDHADEAINRLSKRINYKNLEEETPSAIARDLIENALKKIKEAKKKLERLLTRIPEKSPRITGMLASTEKRQAEVMYRASILFNDETRKQYEFSEETRKRYESEHLELLQKARDYYWASFLLKRSDSWGIVQYLSLTLTLQNLKKPEESALSPEEAANEENNERIEKDPKALWSLARLLSLYDLNNREVKMRIWAYGNLIELYLLSFAMNLNADAASRKEAKRKALEYTDALLDIADRSSFEVYSTRRQVLRYLEWFNKISKLDPLAFNLAEKIFEKFPEDIMNKKTF